jgi:uncharacterized lipoprotein YddW (UPF0748 family)
MNIVDEVVTKYDIDAIHLMIISILIDNWPSTTLLLTKNTEKT